MRARTSLVSPYQPVHRPHVSEQRTRGKNFDGSGPLGPFVVTSDEIPDPFDLDLSTTLIVADVRSASC